MTAATLQSADAFGSLARNGLNQQADRTFADLARAPVRGDHDLNPGQDIAEFAPNPRPAAVLVPIVPRADGLKVILTLRSEDLPTHGGQVAFPGGKMDAADATPLETALRETREEIGVTRDWIDVLGCLDTYQTGTGFRILPVVALLMPGFKLTMDPSEVADIFEVPLDFLMNPANHQRHSIEWRGATRYYYAMPYGDRYIWGATAGIIRNLQETLFGT